MKKLIILFLLALAWPAWGATYYVRQDGEVLAAAKANAISCSAAATALNVTQHNAATFSAGDNIVLCAEGGDITTQLNLPSSGSSGSPITYINQGTFANTTDAAGVYANTKDYITFSGGYYSSQPDNSNAGSAVFYLDSCTYWRFDSGIEITGSGNGINLTSASSNITIDGAYVHDNTFPAVASKNSAGIGIRDTTTEVTVTNSRIIDNGQTAEVGGLNEGCGIRVDSTGAQITITKNIITGNGNHTTGQGAGIEGANTDSVTVNANYISGGTCVEMKNGADDWIFTNNRCIGTGAAVFDYGKETTASTGLLMYNNTFVSLRAAGSDPDYGGIVGISNPSGGTFFNNILVHLGTMASSKITPWTFSGAAVGDAITDQALLDNLFDNNLYYGTDDFIKITDDGTNWYSYASVAAYQAAFANQNQNSVESNPGLNSSYQISKTSSAYGIGRFIDTFHNASGAIDGFGTLLQPVSGLYIFNQTPSIGAHQPLDKKPQIVPVIGSKTKLYAYVSTDGPDSGDGLLLESGTYFLILETGDYLLLE